MAQVYNPITKQYEDDGTGLSTDPSGLATPPDVTSVAPPPAMGNPSASPVPAAPAVPPLLARPAPAPVNVTVGTPKPVWETKSGGSTRQAVQGDASKAAEKQLDTAQQADIEATQRAGNVDVVEASLTATTEEQKQAEKVAEVARKAAAEAKRNEDRQKWLRGERSLVDAEIAAKKRSVDPKADLFQGRPVAKTFSNILSFLGEIAAGVAQRGGYEGKNRVDTTLDKIVADHKAKLVADWESKVDNKKLFKENQAAWELAKDRVETAAINDSQARLDLLTGQLTAEIAKLGPDKKRAATDVLNAAKAKQDAEREAERAQKYDKMSEKTWDRTDRDPTSGMSAKGNTMAEGAIPELYTNETIGIAADPKSPNYHAILTRHGGTVTAIQKMQELKQKVLKMKTMDRLAPGWSELGQDISEDINNLEAPMTQALGSGVPGEKEAARTKESLSASIKKNPEQAAKDLEDRIQYFERNYRNAAATLIGPSYDPNKPRDRPAPPTGGKDLGDPRTGAKPFDKNDPTTWSDQQLDAAIKKAEQRKNSADFADFKREQARRRGK